MENDDAYERRKHRRLRILGTMEPCCGMCGETDWRCMEADHVAGKKSDDTTICLCLNCHRKKSAVQLDFPPLDPNADPMLDRIGRFLLGLAVMLQIIVEKLFEFGRDLIARASAHPGDGVPA